MRNDKVIKRSITAKIYNSDNDNADSDDVSS